MGYIGVVDYGMGNLRSVSKAVEHLGGKVYVGSSQRKLLGAQKLILPGVGAFGDAIRELRKRKLIDALKTAAEKKTPLLGICLGLQLFFEKSAESPGVKGLGIWKGTVQRFKHTKRSTLKVPHMGWNQVNVKRKSPVMQKVKNRNFFYFVHSYYAKPNDSKLVVGSTNYGVSFPAVLASDSVFATQFHPEKSQTAGLQILKNFIKLKPC